MGRAGGRVDSAAAEEPAMTASRSPVGRGRSAFGLAFVALSLSFPCGARGQQPPADLPRVTGAAELTLFNVDVVVTGKDGKPVAGLAAVDFTVRHGGRPATITNFREERPAGSRAAAASPAPHPAGPPAAPADATAASPELPDARRVPRHVIVFVDHLALPDPREREEVFGSLKALLRNSISPGDGAMVVAWKGGVQRVFPFTDDVPLLEARLDAVSRSAIRLGRDVQEELDKLAGDDLAYAWAGVGDSSMSRNLNVQQAYTEFKGKATALTGLVASMAGMEGRKALVLVSRSFSRRPGAEFFGTTMDTRGLLDRLVAKANAAGVTIHSLYAAAWESEAPNVSNSMLWDPRAAGASGLSRAQAKWVGEMAALEDLADETGGVVIGTTMEAPLFAERVASDLDSWYSIGYPAPAGAGRDAAVEVRVNRPGVTVRLRRSVVERSADEEMEDRVLANLFRADANARLPIAVTSGKQVKERKGRYVTPLVVRVPVRRLVLLPSPAGAKGAVSLFVVSGGAGGDFSDVSRERREVELPAAAVGPASTEIVTFETQVVTADPGARVSIGVRDEVGGEAGFRLLSPSR